MNVANYIPSDMINGIGLRHSLFVSGCRHCCKGCFNKEAWDFNYGEVYTKEIENEILKDLDNEFIDGLSILGGEPFEAENIPTLIKLCKKVKKMNKNIWVWSGFTFEQILEDKNKKELLTYVDVLVDGKFVEELKDLKLRFRGSSNQRVLDVQKSLKAKKIKKLKF